MNLTLDMKSTKALVDTLDRIAANMRDTGPVMVLIGRFLQTATARRWRKGVSPDGVPWKAPGALALGQRPGGGSKAKTLWSSGQLFKSVTSRIPAQDQVFRTDKTSAVIGTNAISAHIHQEGGTIRPRLAKKLAIPLNRKAALAGGARKWWSTYSNAQGTRPFIWNRRYIATMEGRRGLKLHFILLDSVTIPARPFLGIAKEDQDPLANLVASYLLRQKEVAPDAGV